MSLNYEKKNIIIKEFKIDPWVLRLHIVLTCMIGDISDTISLS